MHSERVSEIARKIAMKYALGTAFTNRVALAGKLHDIGKITVSEDILDKPGRLNDDEYGKIKRHPETGFKILASVAEYLDIANVVLSHHEWWNGKGYPRGLKDHQAPLESRIINVADAFDAMTVTRSYREAFSIDRAIKELKDFAGRQFDPDVVEKIVELYENNDL
jgi:HD-GYP domain-containing protein (c-di-GMP phosphodiesterase class II)